MRTAFLAVLLLSASSAAAQMYRWVDERGTVHYSNEAPPPGVSAAKVDIDADARVPVSETAECYTAQCEAQRLDQRIARRQQIEARVAAERSAPAPRKARGLEARAYAAISRGMTENELLEIAGEPDLLLWDSRTVKTYTYYPTDTEPYATTVTLLNGRVTETERLRR
jgi:Domain of unknown function (DUF4124)